MTELAFFPRVCCSFVGHGCDFEGETEFRCKRISSELALKLKQSEAYSGQPAQPALRHPASQPTSPLTTRHPRACVRADLPVRSRPDLRDVPRLARARPPRVTELTAQQRTWTGRDGGVTLDYAWLRLKERL